MRRLSGSRLGLVTILVVFLVAVPEPLAENIDPADDGSQYAYAENVGWINAEPSGAGGPGVQVGDSELSGWMWAENVGWVSLSCKNTLTCATANYGVANDGSGVLSGFAWAENVGWVSFSCSNTGSCGTASYGVSIDPSTGDFDGRAWAENVGWITFASAAPVPFKVKASWICSPPPASPSGTPSLTVDGAGSDALLTWGAATGSTGYDIVQGDLGVLRSSGGDYSAATGQCLDNNRTTTTLLDPDVLAPGQGVWYVMRGQNCGGNGTYDSGGPSQAGARDGEIVISGNDCP